jgi:predicted helicase
MSVRSLLDKIRSVATSTSDQGSRFEELMRLYFLHDPTYQLRFSDVWLWKDFPERDNKPDTGIDLVAKNRDNEGYTAIQCKFNAEDYTIQRTDIDSFLVQSSKKPFTRRIIVSTTAHWGTNAEEAIHGLHPHVQRLDINALDQSTIDWSAYDVNKPKITVKPNKQLRTHQESALEKVREGFQTADRGKLIMACGTGKTFTSLKIAEVQAGKSGIVLFLVPSLSLLSQTLREWTAESAVPLHCYAVCSDIKIGKHDDGDPTTPDDLAIPATTDGKELAKSFVKQGGMPPCHHDKMTVVFSTYQSIDAIHNAQQHGLPKPQSPCIVTPFAAT